MEVLAEEAEKVAALLSEIPGSGAAIIEKVDGLPQLTATYKRDKLAQYGIKVSDINKAIMADFSGITAGVILEGEKKFDLVLRFDKKFRQDITDLSQLHVLTDNGVKIPLDQIAEVNYKEGPAQISHDNTKRRIVIGFNVVGRDVESVVNDIRKRLEEKIKLPAGYYVTFGGQFQNLTEAKERLSVAVPIALLLIFALLFFTFNSFKQAMLIFTAIPFSAIGGVFALYLRGMPFSISAGVGFIALFGVAVLNGIVLIGYFNQLKKEGMENTIQRIITGTRVRLRPVILTAAVASLGFLPMALSVSAGAEVQKPLATVVIGGLISATLLTLIVLPVLYFMTERFRFRASGKMNPLLLLLCIPGTGMVVKAQSTTTLSEWTGAALKNNYAIQAADAELHSNRYNKRTAGEIGKTNISLMYGQYNSFANDNNLSLMQTLPFPATFSARAKLGNALIESTVQKKKMTETEVVYQIKLAYYNLLFLNQSKALLQVKDSMYRMLLKTATLRYVNGESNMLEKSIAAVHSGETTNELKGIDQDKMAWYAHIKALSGIAINTFTDSSFAEAAFTLPPDSGMSATNPALLYVKEQIKVAESQKRLEQFALLPDITFGYFAQTLYGVPYGNDASAPVAGFGRRFQGFSAGISIPLWAAPQAARIKAAEASCQQAAALYESARCAAQSEMESTYAAYLKHKRNLQFYHTQGVPGAELIMKHATAELQKGEITHAEYAFLMQRVFDIKQRFLDTLLEYNKSVVKLEYLSGHIN